ncbi:hypothetical protein G8T75_12730 [Clostridium botulinum D/C]|uniref:hypothetical protein n=1 Tax=Clostridium botulinum TaxID=1491 RepID=UPI001E559463|nr:hypothetical protein [Clostridium botulinum]MCD3240822.1 hypothetical protein [Clostridium botulinum D/C]
MAHFEELNKYIFDIINKILENEDLSKLLYYTDKKPLQHDNLTQEQKDELIKNNIFPYFFVPTETDNNERVIVNIVLDNFENGGKQYFKAGLIKFNILVCNNLQITNEGLRVFKIMSELDKMFNSVNYRDFNKQRPTTSLGGNNFINANALWANNKYTGYTLSYSCLNFS